MNVIYLDVLKRKPQNFVNEKEKNQTTVAYGDGQQNGRECEQKLSNANITEVQTSVFCSGVQIKQQKITSTPVFFGGDTYVNRYTEKNTMFFFYDWLYDQPDGFEYNYYKRQMIGAPRFWANSQKYDINNLGELFNIEAISNLINGTTVNATTCLIELN